MPNSPGLAACIAFLTLAKRYRFRCRSKRLLKNPIGAWGAEMQGKMTMVFATAVLFTLASTVAWGQVNVGEQKPEATLPFKMTTTGHL